MKFRLLLLLFLAGAVSVLAQSKYPLVTVHDIQYIDSVATKGFVPSPLVGDTVRVQGTVLVRPVVDPSTNRNPILYIGSRWGTYIQTPNSTEWGGMNVILDSTATGAENTFFDLVDTAQVVELTGVVIVYYSTIELSLIPNIPVNIISSESKRPDPIQLSVSDLMNGQSGINAALKYSGMYAEIKSTPDNKLISGNRNTSSGAFNLYDKDGNQLAVYPQSRYFRLDSHKMPGATYDVPQDGTPVNSVRGIISVFSGAFEIIPLYPDDINITATPPIISNILRDKIQVHTGESITISAHIQDLDGTVESAALHYRIDNAKRVTVPMQKSSADTTLYTAEIPAVGTDSSMVDYYISSVDNDGLEGYAPSDTVKGNYFYQILNETLSVRDVQYSPFGSGYSSYNGYPVTLTGIVTADTSDIPGFGSSTPLRIYMQQGSGPWTGILIGTHGLKGADALKFKRGDSVTLTGTIVEDYGVTSIDSLQQITINSHDNALPDAVTVTTGEIDKSSSGVVAAEQYESVLIDYKDITVTDDNADGDSGPGAYNFGEIFVNDGSGDTRVELQDGNHNYHNFWDSTLSNNPANIGVNTNSKFSEMRGILFYSFSNYKLVPRQNDDFTGFVVNVQKENPYTPVSYQLSQNYPNPFNPSTTINFSIPKESRVTVKIFDILGQEVRTLVNEDKMPGNYRVNFNANNLSSGIYFYSINAGNFYHVKKMMLLK